VNVLRPRRAYPRAGVVRHADRRPVPTVVAPQPVCWSALHGTRQHTHV
jgi:hypothetical protein